MFFFLLLLLLTPTFTLAAVSLEGQLLPGTQRLTETGDMAALMVSGIDAYLERELRNAVRRREESWKQKFASPEPRNNARESLRQLFSRRIGAVDPCEPAEMTASATFAESSISGTTAGYAPSAKVGEGQGYGIYAVRWNVLAGVEGEGLLLLPDRPASANVVALPNCDWTPEMAVGLAPGAPVEAQFARRLAQSGCRVLVPVLMDRRDTYSGIPEIKMTNQPHREFIYRAAYEMGRHIIGYEVEKTLAAVDWFSRQFKTARPACAVGVIGYGEGGLIAMYAAAADRRIDAVAVCGYFQPRESLWREPIYRNVWGLLRDFGDAEIAALIAPRTVVIEAGRGPEIAGPPQTPGRSGAAPGVLRNPPLSEIEREFQRAQDLVRDGTSPCPLFFVRNANSPGNEETLKLFLKGLGIERSSIPVGEPPIRSANLSDAEARFRRQFNQLVQHTQTVMRESEFERARFWSKADVATLSSWEASCAFYRDYFWDEVIGRLPPADAPMNPRVRLVYDEPAYRGYEVQLDVYPDVFAYGILLVPKGIRDGERRPVVVCQHGLEGRPQDVADPKTDNHYYHQFACRLAEQGFVTFSPQNPYIGGDAFRVLQRKANPLKLSLFSFIVRQHERILEWLSSLPFVDSSRMAFYGLSYGGKTAMRVPALLPNYCLSICSGDYNEWIWKNVSARHTFSYLLTGEYEMPEFNLGNTFNYSELSGLIIPRPFMVERGHQDGVAPDEWVGYEFAKTRRLYDRLGIGDRTEIEFFNGPHSIHGVGTFEFLRKQLRWPETKS